MLRLPSGFYLYLRLFYLKAYRNEHADRAFQLNILHFDYRQFTPPSAASSYVFRYYNVLYNSAVIFPAESEEYEPDYDTFNRILQMPGKVVLG
ncbi:hypothetical protein PAAG_06860 [Paracoccidioides lutzii Pb01]|uniref:Uncharacterized protein n=1 Tax=Paracoccidioides lutzii (strain ATCC MYA-826 / Pb01) TaxID=502779 RepID=C1H7W9_PARBA|nr:hypothetical protein PAAG_06860 [Paracoccidioides lutzii Pb01]EEH36442.1 hypothetical protein PAAG_06860 [Paracoccidioides lutzii Pb01]